MADLDDSDAAWDQWRPVQDGLCREVTDRIGKVSAGRSDQFRAALAASLIEHLGELMRSYMKLPARDFQPGGETGDG